jgi:UDP-N-acetylglucosamine 2-epimerase
MQHEHQGVHTVKRHFIPTQINAAQLTNMELRSEALRHKGNPTLEIYRMVIDRSLDHRGKTEEVLYIGDERMALVSWEGRALVCDDVDSAGQALEQVLRDWEG